MSQIPLPAPLWRRLIAGVYDLLLLLGLWMVAAWLLVILSSLSGIPVSTTISQALYFMIGAVFFGVSWSRGGQTLGMKAWRLVIRRQDAGSPRLPVAVLRYTAAWFSLGLLGLGFFWSLIDARRRTWHDIIASTEMLVMPKP